MHDRRKLPRLKQKGLHVAFPSNGVAPLGVSVQQLALTQSLLEVTCSSASSKLSSIRPAVECIVHEKPAQYRRHYELVLNFRVDFTKLSMQRALCLQ